MTLFDKQGKNAEVECCVGIKSATMAQPPTHTSHSIPLFHYDPPKVGRHSFGVILVNCEIFHIIQNMEKFYSALGYDKRAKYKQACDEEFIWERYRRDNAKMSMQCLQIQIQIYLHNNSNKFRELYGQAYDAMIGNCCSNVSDKADQHCANCPMLPRL